MSQTVPLSVPPQPGPWAVELVGIDKRFGPVHANKAVSLRIRAGSIHGLVGENGAGKSTLMSILYGFYQADEGQILVNGAEVRIREPKDAIALGIGMVHQHFMLVEEFTVLENLMLGAEGGALLKDGIKKARAEVERLEKAYRLDVPLDAKVADLNVGIQQRVEILKALYRGAQVLILDEPTAVLSPPEVQDLFRILDALRAQGRTILMITHKLKEIMAITDAVSVLRQGAVVANFHTQDTNEAALAEAMVGRRANPAVRRPGAPAGAPLLTVEDLSVFDERGVERLKHATFRVRAGEIVGVAGVAGNGQSELLEALSGMTPFQRGRVHVNGRDVTPESPMDPAQARRQGIAHVPEDRLRRAVVKPFPAFQNALLGYQDDPAMADGPRLNWKRVAAATARLMEDWDVRPRQPSLRTSLFSGGNQQKLVLGREMERDPNVLLVGQPTRGVDIGAIEFIHRRLLTMRDAGKAILLVSAELEEIMALSDRILVMCDGAITGELAAEDATEGLIGRLMAGITDDIEPNTLERGQRTDAAGGAA
ncbi:ABC transporter ATP-binding protein [Nitrospirillum viridazoti]|uniref:ABC transporter ATP-binding protein n=1 Tax=Nitrospirillum viridazoti TaxID=3144925 RepID=UPI0011ADD297|nr:ABC transporter ATP-binding protein [Nitrospirillum amazonense]TWB32795.1 nucleoside ABC transporter ATP-binding protein [Nitrospirillum amazonense]